MPAEVTRTGDEASSGSWEPQRQLQKVTDLEVRLSRGFLRSHPERWFPGFGAHWLALAHSLGADLRFVEARPILSDPPEGTRGFVCSIDDEPIGIFADEQSSNGLVEAIVPDAQGNARDLVAEYLARRFLATLILSWSGPESSVVRYEPELSPESVKSVASVKLTAAVNNVQCTVWVALGKLLVDRLDGLWRRQLRSSIRGNEGNQELRIELAQLAVPPTSLIDYLRSGALIDLEIPLGDTVLLRLAGKPWQHARLRNSNGHLVCEATPGVPLHQTIPEGATRLAVEMGSLPLDRGSVLELSQPGAMLDTQQQISDLAALVINNERVGEGRLRMYEGRFALAVS